MFWRTGLKLKVICGSLKGGYEIIMKKFNKGKCQCYTVEEEKNQVQNENYLTGKKPRG